MPMQDDEDAPLHLPFEPLTALVGISYRLKLLFFFCLVAFCVGFVVSRTYGTRSFEAESVLMYIPPINDETSGVQVPRLESRKHMIKLEKNVEMVKTRLGLTESVFAIGEACEITVLKETQVLSIHVTWNDPVKAAGIANALRDVFLENQRGLLREGLQRQVDELTRQVENAHKTLDTALDRQKKFQKDTGIMGTEHDAKYLLEELANYEVQLDQAKLEKYRTENQLKGLPAIVAGLEKAVVSERKDMAFADSVRDGVTRSERLRDVIRDDRDQRSWKAEMEHLAKEKERLAKGLKLRIVSQSDYDKVKGQYEKVRALAVDTKNISGWKKQLDELDKTIIPKQPSIVPSQAMLNDLRMKAVNLQLDMIALDEKIKTLAATVRRLKERQSALPDLHKQLTQLTGEVRRCELALDSLQAPLNLAKRSLDSQRDDFQVVSSASVPQVPFQSKRKLVLLGTAAVLLVLLCLPILLYEMFYPRIRSVRELAYFLEAPARSRRQPANTGQQDALVEAENNMNEIYELVRSWLVHGPKQTQRIWISGVDFSTDVSELVDEIAGHAVMQGLATSVIHIGGKDPTAETAAPRGNTLPMIAYLQGRQDVLGDALPSVDSTGILRVELAALAQASHLLTSPRMQEFLATLEKGSDVVILHGPSGKLGTDAVHLARTCSHVVLVAEAEVTRQRDVKTLAAAFKGGNGGLEGVIEGVQGRFRLLV
jgi:uncharacterized protein involved in exopolysaccharide biosynthesis